MTDTHRCMAGRDCRDAENIDDPTTGKTHRLGAVIAEETGLCPGCCRRIQNAIEDLPFDYVALHVALGEAGNGVGGKVRSTPTPAIPIDVNKYSLMTAISENLDRAAEIVSEALNCDPPAGKIAPRLTRAARMVSTNLPKLIASDDVPLWVWEKCDTRCGKNGCDAGEHFRLSDRNGIQTALALRDLHRRARRTVGEFDRVIRIERPCGECGAPALHQNPTSGNVYCKDCGHEWTEELLGLAGRMIRRQEQEKRDMAINESLRVRAEQAEWRVAELEWQLQLALDCTEVSAADFAREILTRSTKTPVPQGKICS